MHFPSLLMHFPSLLMHFPSLLMHFPSLLMHFPSLLVYQCQFNKHKTLPACYKIFVTEKQNEEEVGTKINKMSTKDLYYVRETTA